MCEKLNMQSNKDFIFYVFYKCLKKNKNKNKMRLPGVEPGSIAWKAIILTVGLQTLLDDFISDSLYISNI